MKDADKTGAVRWAPWLGDCTVLLDQAAEHLGPKAGHSELCAFIEQRLMSGES